MAACAALVLLAAAPAAASGPDRDEPWWVPVGLRGGAVAAVHADGDRIDVVSGGREVLSGDAGRHFRDAGPARPVDTRCAEAVSGTDRWLLCGGHVLHAGLSTGPPVIDPTSPDLGPSARLIAAPAALPGVVVAVAADGTVWRRTAASAWGLSLLLLPQSLVSGPPRITAAVAFSAPLTDAVYLSSDGYGVLESTDGGDDWIRVDVAGLPGRVFALATDAGARAVYAGTSDGLWVHHLRAVPAPPAYPVTELRWRWLGTALVSLAGCLAAVAGLRRAVS